MITVTVIGENRPARRLEGKANRAANMAPAFLKSFEYLEGVEKRQFNSEGIQSGNPWAPLKEATIARKAAKGQDLRTLHADEIMRESLTMDAPGAVRIITPHRAVFGTSVPYAAYHQDPAPGGLPRRPPIDLTEFQRRSINLVQMTWVSDGVAKLPYAK